MLNNKIAYCKELVDYFPGFFTSEEVLLYKLYFLTNNNEEIEKFRQQHSDEQIERYEKEAKDKVFNFAYEL